MFASDILSYNRPRVTIFIYKIRLETSGTGENCIYLCIFREFKVIHFAWTAWRRGWNIDVPLHLLWHLGLYFHTLLTEGTTLVLDLWHQTSSWRTGTWNLAVEKKNSFHWLWHSTEAFPVRQHVESFHRFSNLMIAPVVQVDQICVCVRVLRVMTDEICTAVHCTYWLKRICAHQEATNRDITHWFVG